MSKIQNALTTYKYYGIRGVLRKIQKNSPRMYNRFIRKENIPTFELMQQELQKYPRQPKISVITPVYKPQFSQLMECVVSVAAQGYRNIEHVLVVDGYINDDERIFLEKLSEKKKIVLKINTENNGISYASNEAIAMSDGEFITLLDQDDVLAEHALFEVVKKLNEDDYDFVYTDEDMLSESGKRIEPMFKPEFSPHTLMSRMYINHLSVYKREIIEKIGFFRSDFDGCQDYDLLLRASRNFKRVGHIPKVLYHWRKSENSIATNIENKAYIFKKAKLAIEEHLSSFHLSGEVKPHDGMLIYDIELQQTDGFVSIIIPYKDNFLMTKTCIQSILKYCDLLQYEIILANNQSEENENIHFMSDVKNLCENKCDLQFYNADYAFNYSKINNECVKIAKGDILLFMNNDIELTHTTKLSQLVEVAKIPFTGACGATLVYPDNTIQHAGVVMGYHEVAGHSGVGLDARNPGYYGRNVSFYNFSCITAALMAVEKDKFIAVHGFDESLAVAYNDVDFCLKLLEKGLYNVNQGNVQAIHKESVSRGSDVLSDQRYQNEVEFMQTKWQSYIENDPFYSENLSINVGEMYTIKRK